MLEVYVGAVEGDHGDQLTQKVFQLVVRALERQDQVVKQAAKYRLDFLRKIRKGQLKNEAASN